MRVNLTSLTSSVIFADDASTTKHVGVSVNDERSRYTIKVRQLYLNFTKTVTQENKRLFSCSVIPLRTFQGLVFLKFILI